MRMCPDCGSTDLHYDAERGELTCRACGLVLEDRGQLPYENELSAEVDRLGRRQALRLRDEPRRPTRLNSEGARIRESIERARRLNRAAREAPSPDHVVANPEEVMRGGRAEYARTVEVPGEVEVFAAAFKAICPGLSGMRPDKLRSAVAKMLRLDGVALRLHPDPRRALRDLEARLSELLGPR